MNNVQEQMLAGFNQFLDKNWRAVLTISEQEFLAHIPYTATSTGARGFLIEVGKTGDVRLVWYSPGLRRCKDSVLIPVIQGWMPIGTGPDSSLKVIDAARVDALSVVRKHGESMIACFLGEGD